MLIRRDIDTPRVYGLPKVHKEDVPLRPIVSAMKSPIHPLAKYLAHKLTPLAENVKSEVKNSSHFIDIIKTVKITNTDILVSFDVTSLFTKIPVDEALTIMRDKMKFLYLPEEWAYMTELCLKSTFFSI